MGNVNPIGIRSCYDEGKRAAETLCFDYRRQHAVDARVIRIFNTYGPRMAADDGRVVSNFVVQALRGEELTIYGKGEQTRSFCYVDDLVEGIIRVADLPPGDHGPVNLGNDGEFTMLELAAEVMRQVGSQSRIGYRPLPSDDPKCRRPDLTKARALLGGWTPRVPLKTSAIVTMNEARCRKFHSRHRTPPQSASNHRKQFIGAIYRPDFARNTVPLCWRLCD